MVVLATWGLGWLLQSRLDGVHLWKPTCPFPLLHKMTNGFDQRLCHEEQQGLGSPSCVCIPGLESSLCGSANRPASGLVGSGCLADMVLQIFVSETEQSMIADYLGDCPSRGVIPEAVRFLKAVSTS